MTPQSSAPFCCKALHLVIAFASALCTTLVVGVFEGHYTVLDTPSYGLCISSRRWWLRLLASLGLKEIAAMKFRYMRHVLCALKLNWEPSFVIVSFFQTGFLHNYVPQRLRENSAVFTCSYFVTLNERTLCIQLISLDGGRRKHQVVKRKSNIELCSCALRTMPRARISVNDQQLLFHTDITRILKVSWISIAVLPTSSSAERKLRRMVVILTGR